VVIVGATAVGKTELSIKVAQTLQADIISADSRLFYIGMDIGTAKPSAADRKLVTHHMIDIAYPEHSISLAEYQSMVKGIIAHLHQRGILPILVGGTGQYIHAITHGWNIPASKPNPALRLALQQWSGQIGAQGLHDRLACIDPTAAKNIDPQNLRRTIRALEVILSTGRLFSVQRHHTPPPYPILQIGLTRPRSELYKRIDDRISAMLEAGLIAETQRLLSQGYDVDLPAFSAIGYREVITYLRGGYSLDEAITSMKRRTRIFVRRQANWFKESDPQIHWFKMEPETAEYILQTIHNWLTNLSNNPH
jgi:tRNA dimethylallyltransferase